MKSFNILTIRNRNLAYLAAVILTGGGITAGIAWAEMAQSNNLPPRPSDAPKLQLNEHPLEHNHGLTDSYAPVVRKVMPSVVRVSVTVKAKTIMHDDMTPDFGGSDMPNYRWFYGDRFPGQQMPRMPKQHGEGSGVIVTKDGYILTNNHVVDNADEVKITLPDKREFTAKVIGKDPKTDVAVVKIDARNLPPMEIADSDKVEVGDFVLAIGNPFGIGQTVTMGMVSAKGRAPLGLDYEDFIQTDAAINPGNSGGALVDVDGRLVGINTAILSRSGGNQGIGFAVPSNLAREVMDGLITHGHVIRGYLGVMIQNVTPELAKALKLKENSGALVSDVTPHSPAGKAGISDGDVIMEFHGKNVADSRQLKLMVAETRPGETISVKILRQGESRMLEVKVGELPGEPSAIHASTGGSEKTDTLQGVSVADLNGDNRQQYEVPDNIHGALVTGVEDNSAADHAGLKPGDVILSLNHHEVKNADDAVKLTENAKDKNTLVRVWTKSGTHFVVVEEIHGKNG